MVVSGPVYLVRKALMPGDSKALYFEARAGSIPAAIMWLGMAFLVGCLFLAFASQARANEWIDKAGPYLGILDEEISTHWPDVPSRAVLAGQPEQETCLSVKSPKCWNPRAELKTSREVGFGLGQLTVTSRFDNFTEARKLHPSLRKWEWDDRHNAALQLRTMILMDKAAWHRLSVVTDAKERMAMMLAWYNGGGGGVLSDRRICAAVEGCDPNIWFGNVELHSLKCKVASKGYGKSFFEINREYCRNILGFRSGHYVEWFKLRRVT